MKNKVNNFNFIEDKFSDRELYSLFILNWDSIYSINAKGYRKDMIVFKDKEEYKSFVTTIKEKLKSHNSDYLDHNGLRIYIEYFNKKETINVFRIA